MKKQWYYCILFYMRKNYVPFFTEKMSKKEVLQLNPLVLAFIGDSVQTLYVRTKLSLNILKKAGELHNLTSKEINAASQSIALKKILPCLTEDEKSIYKRARNSKTSSSAKNASITDYHTASGFEAVVGYLYLMNQSKRLNELITIAYSEI